MTDTAVPVYEDPGYPNLATALAAFQARIPSVRKGQTAKVETAKGSYSYDYADLADVTEVALPVLASVGLTWITRPDTSSTGAIDLHYSLVHGASEEKIEGSVPVGKAGDNWQNLGSALTYARRYMLICVTGIAPGGDDNDGAEARAGSAPVQPAVKQYLPVGIYDLAGIKTRKQAEAMFYVARGAGHLGLYVQTPSGDEVLFGDWLRATGSALPEVEPEDEPKVEAEDAEAAEARAVAEHEAEIARQEAAAREAGPEVPDAPEGDR